MTSSWTTTDPAPNPMKPSLVERAMKRDCYEGAAPDVYVVVGNDSLGDKYPHYLVRFDDGYENGVTCDCLNPNRTGGQYRKTCSHITRAMLHREEWGPWGGGPVEDDPEPEEPTPDPARKAEDQPIVEDEGDDAASEGSLEVATPSPPPSTPLSITPPSDNGLWNVDDPDLWEILEDPDFLPFPNDVRVSPSDPPLPEKFQEYRADQWHAVLEIEAALEEGYKAVFVSAPTGSGKTLIAESVRRLRGTRAIYTCLTPDSLIRTSSGYKAIQDISVNDRVVGREGRPVSVSRIIPKHHEGSVLEIHTAYQGFPISVTPDHLIQVVTRVTSGEAWTPVEKMGNLEPRWVEAQDLKTGEHKRDYVVWPISNDESFQTTDDWIRVIGWYVTEGYVGAYQRGEHYQVMFSLGAHEQTEVDELCLSLSDLGFSPSVRVGETNTLIVTVNSVELVKELKEEVGKGAANKSLPEWVSQLPRTQRQLLLDVLIQGDGSDDGRHCQYATVSQQLALQVRELALSLGYLAGITVSPLRNTIIDGRTIRGNHKLLNVRWDKAPVKSHGYINDDVAYLPIKKIVEKPYSGVVIDLEIPDGSAFATSTGVVHNCTTKTLQDQILREFEYAEVLKGRSNYPTADKPDEFPNLNALDCTKRKMATPACQNCPGWSGGDSWKTQGRGSGQVGDDFLDDMEVFHCNWCHPVSKCPYESAKYTAARARLAVLNTAYFLAETNFIGNSLFKGRPLVLIDEADLLEEELMRFIEVTITAKDRKLLGIGLPEKKTVDDSWVVWINDEVIPAIKKALSHVDLSPDLFGNPEVKEIRKKNKLTRLLSKVKTLIEEEVDEETGDTFYTLNKDWVYTGYEKDWRTGKYPPDDRVNVSFKPIHVREYAPSFLWNKGQQFVLLSATLISPAQMAWDLGLEDDEWTVVEVPSSFPVLQRPIIPRTVANVVNKQLDQAIPLLIDEVRSIMEEHPDDRILVHSVSYRLTKDLLNDLTRDPTHGKRVGAYLSANEREGALRRYLSISNGVLIAPSFDRGVDLPADDCRVVVVAKIPYMSVGDKQVSARLYGTGKSGKTWYAVQAIRTLCQMTGRGMRSADDSCRTYVLDKQFVELYNRNRKLFPKWWADAIVWDENDPKWRGMA